MEARTSGRRRARGAPRRRARRPAAGRRPAGRRTRGRRCPPGGVEGVHEGGAGLAKPGCPPPGATAPSTRGGRRPGVPWRSLAGPWVVKTDGLAAPAKGVLVAARPWPRPRPTSPPSCRARRSATRPAAAVVIEEGLIGSSARSWSCATGTGRPAASRPRPRTSSGSATATPVPTRAAWAPTRPCPVVDARAPGLDRLMESSVLPVVAELRRRGIDYRGVLYAGLMLTAAGPKVLEYNVRFGDPEAQVVLPRLADDPVALLRAVAEGRLGQAPAERAEAQVCVVLAAAGLPGCAPTRRRHQRPRPRRPAGHRRARGAGAARRHHPGRPDGPFTTTGGRVLGVVGTGADLAAARACRLRRRSDAIGLAGGRFRTDIAARRPGRLGRRRPVRRRPVRHTDPRSRPVIGRYSPPDIAALFSDEARMATWLEVELLAVEALARAGVVPGRSGGRLPPAGPGGRRRPSWRRWPSANGRRTTTWPRSSTWSRRASVPPRPPGSTSGSPRRTWSTPPGASRWFRRPTC